jgi:glycosyltransferase involved in cell wall biosynthesis
MNVHGAAVLQVIVSTQAGGGPHHVLALVRWLRARGWQPLVAGPADGPLFQRFREAGVDIVAVPTRVLDPRTLLTLMRLVRTRNIRLVHSHGKGAGVYGRLLARLQGVHAVHTFHGLHFERYGRLRRAAYLALERRLAAWTDIVINVSRTQEAEGRALGLFSARQSRVVRNGVDAARLTATALGRQEARAELRVDAHAPLIGCAARFDLVKRLDVLLESAAAMTPAPCVALIGAGEEGPALRALTARLGLGGRVVFPGEIPDAARLFAAFDVYCAPSSKEGMPLGVLEAMALGVPVVASDIPAHREVLGDTSPGLAPSIPGGFARTVATLLTDAAARAALGAEQRTRARSEFDAREMLEATEAIYGQLLRV